MESSQSMNRRALIRRIFIVSGGLAITWKSGLAATNNQLTSSKRSKQTIRAFIETIVPGVDTSHPGITTLFYEPSYGFAKYRPILLFSLANQSQKLFNTRDFTSLSLEQRAAVIRNGLKHKGKIGQLYSGAIFAGQATVYTGFYKERESCDIIHFTSRFGFDQTTYPDPDRFNGPAITENGNYN